MEPLPRSPDAQPSPLTRQSESVGQRHAAWRATGPIPVPEQAAPTNQSGAAQHEQERAQARQNRAADKITAVSGSMLFVYIHIVWFGCWIGFGVENYPLMPALIWPMNSEGQPVGQVGKGWARQHPQTTESREPSDRLKPAD